MPLKDQAICLRRTDYSETSLVLRVMTRRHGQASLLAKGAKRPKSRLGPIDLLAVGEAVFILPREHSAGTLGTLTEWDQGRHHPRLRTDLLAHCTGMLAAEVLGALTVELDPHPASFDAMVGLLDALEAGEPALRRLADFARALLTDVGLAPNFATCSSCGRELSGGRPERAGRRPGTGGTAGRAPGELLFCPGRGGVLCPRCPPRPGEAAIRVSPQLCGFFTLGSSIAGRFALETARWFVYYVNYQTGHPLRTAESLERAIAGVLAEHRARR